MKMKRLSGFSLMEMMIVLLIVSIIAAASAPMINRRMVSEAANGCEWEWNNDLSALYFDRLNNAVAIGTSESGRVPPDPNTTPRLHIASEGNPHIRLTDETQTPNVAANISFLNNNTLFTTSAIVTTGAGAVADSVAIGSGSITDTANSIVIGKDAKIDDGRLGYDSPATNSIAIGHSAQVYHHGTGTDQYKSGTNSIAIGPEAKTYGKNSIVIGLSHDVGADNVIAIGSGINVYSKRGDKSNDDSIYIGNSVASSNHDSYGIAIGSGSAIALNSVAIGASANTLSEDISGDLGKRIAIGAESESRGDYDIAIGGEASIKTETKSSVGGSTYSEKFIHPLGAIAIGYQAKIHQTTGENVLDYDSSNSVAIGRGATVKEGLLYATNDTKPMFNKTYHNSGFYAPTNSVAIGYGARAFAHDQIVLGTEDTIVYIPGHVVVGGSTYLGTRSSARTCMRVANMSNPSTYNHMSVILEDSSSLRILKTSSHADGWEPDISQIINRTKDPLGYAERDQYAVMDLTSENGVSSGGQINSSWSWMNNPGRPSDRRLKNVGEAFKAGLAEIKKLELFHYTYKKDSKKTPHVGVMAQDLMKIFPDAVWKGEDGFYRIRMEDMFYALVNAVKELDAKIDAILNNEIAELRKENQEQQKLIEKLEKQNAKLEKRLDILEKKLK